MLPSWLAHWRAVRRFDAGSVLEGKCQVLRNVFQHQGIDAVVVGLSGGLDSALVLGLLRRVWLQPESPLKKVVPLLLPCHSHPGVSNQDQATLRAKRLCKHWGLEAIEADVGPVAQALEKVLSDSCPAWPFDPWGRGQMVANARTPMLYTVTTLLTAAGHRAVVVGTTNRDEGAYLGFVGKASDGMVDIQPISDLHKSEVRALARQLGVTQDILEATPTGDMFDATPDEDVFGAPYDFLEGYLIEKSRCTPEEIENRQASWSEVARKQYQTWAENLERLHRYNAHKYEVGSPAHHLDLLPSAVPGGWRPAPHRPQPPVAKQKWPGHSWASPMALPAGDRQTWLQETFDLTRLSVQPPNEPEAFVWSAHQVLSSEGLKVLRENLNASSGCPAPQDGYWRADNPSEIHSDRITFEDEAFARLLWQRLQPLLPPFRMVPEKGPSDLEAAPGSVWRPVGVNPVFRAIRYREQGSLINHTDAPFEACDGSGRKTLMSLVLYLDADPTQGGELVFVRDSERRKPLSVRNLDDFDFLPSADQVWYRAALKPGDLFLFDHRLRHASLPLKHNGKKMLLRTDLFFERVGPVPREEKK